MSGAKADLVARVLECQRRGGGLPMCPQCHRAVLREAADNAYVCPGSYEGRKFRACGFRSPVASVPRRPWRDLDGNAAAAAAYELGLAAQATRARASSSPSKPSPS